MGGALFKHRGWIPVPLLGLGLIYCQAVGPLTALGLSLIPLGLLIRLWGMLHIGPGARNRKITVQKLVYTGPYELSRNPLYIANIIMYCGVGLGVGGLLGFVVALLASAIHYSLIVRFEEAELERRLGEVYRSYINRVPRWLGESAPVHAAAPKGEMEDRLNRALLAERSTYVVSVVVICVVTLRAFTVG